METNTFFPHSMQSVRLLVAGCGGQKSNGCKKPSGTSMGGGSVQDREVAPAQCFPPSRAVRQVPSQIAFLKRGCSFKFITSASFCFRT